MTVPSVGRTAEAGRFAASGGDSSTSFTTAAFLSPATRNSTARAALSAGKVNVTRSTGGGPMFDMGPYYLHSLITLLGPVKRVAGSTKISFAERTITSQPKNGQKVKVEVPTHVIGEVRAGEPGVEFCV